MLYTTTLYFNSKVVPKNIIFYYKITPIVHYFKEMSLTTNTKGNQFSIHYYDNLGFTIIKLNAHHGNHGYEYNKIIRIRNVDDMQRSKINYVKGTNSDDIGGTRNNFL